MLDQDEIKNILSKFGQDVIAIAQRNLKVKSNTNFRGERYKSTRSPRAISASGNTARALGFNRKVMRNSFQLGFYGNEYVDFVENGRKAGKMPPIEPIMKWIKSKRIKPFKRTKTGGRVFVKQTPSRIKSMAFGIAQKIAEKGTQPTYFYSNAIEEALKRNPELFEQGLIASVDKMVEQINKRFKDGIS